MSATRFEIFKHYNFTTLAPSILGDSYSNMEVIAILKSDKAAAYSDINRFHAILKPLITALPSKVSDCTFILFKSPDGTELLLADEWVDMNTITEVKTVDIRFTVYSTTSNMAAVITARIKELGITNLNTEILTTSS